jgi:hypothetical protein
LGAIPSREFQRDVERDRRRECWNLDVQRGVRLADDKPRSGSADRVIRSSGNDSADIPARAAGRCIGRHRRQATVSHRHRDRDNGGFRPIRRIRLARCGHSADIAAVHIP